MKFAIAGAGGFVAQRHAKAIIQLGHEIVAICDPSSNIGYIDALAPAAQYYPTYEELAYNIPKLGVDYTVICTPNNLHVPQSIIALQAGSNVISEKPLALSASDLDRLQTVSAGTGRSVHTILQLRQHARAQDWRNWRPPKGKQYVRYHSPRGNWYHRTWKGDPRQSGGLLFNIGVHMFDLMLWVFGAPREIWTDGSNERAEGVLGFKDAHIWWELDTSTQTPKREFCNIDLSEGFTDAHTKEYKLILDGKGWTIEDARPAIELIERMR